MVISQVATSKLEDSVTIGFQGFIALLGAGSSARLRSPQAESRIEGLADLGNHLVHMHRALKESQNWRQLGSTVKLSLRQVVLIHMHTVEDGPTLARGQLICLPELLLVYHLGARIFLEPDQGEAKLVVRYFANRIE